MARIFVAGLCTGRQLQVRALHLFLDPGKERKDRAGADCEKEPETTAIGYAM